MLNCQNAVYPGAPIFPRTQMGRNGRKSPHRPDALGAVTITELCDRLGGATGRLVQREGCQALAAVALEHLADICAIVVRCPAIPGLRRGGACQKDSGDDCGSDKFAHVSSFDLSRLLVCRHRGIGSSGNRRKAPRRTSSSHSVHCFIERFEEACLFDRKTVALSILSNVDRPIFDGITAQQGTLKGPLAAARQLRR